MLEEKLEEQERASAEVMDLQWQLENMRRRIGETTGDRRPHQCFDNVSDRMDALFAMYDRSLNDVDESKRENHELRCGVRAKTYEQMQIVGKIKRMENNKRKIAKCVQELRDEVRDEQVMCTVM